MYAFASPHAGYLGDRLGHRRVILLSLLIWSAVTALTGSARSLEDYVRSYCLAMERRRRFGVYFIFKSMEQGPTFRSVPPKFPTDDPDYRILKLHITPRG